MSTIPPKDLCQKGEQSFLIQTERSDVRIGNRKQISARVAQNQNKSEGDGTRSEPTGELQTRETGVKEKKRLREKKVEEEKSTEEKADEFGAPIN